MDHSVIGPKRRASRAAKGHDSVKRLRRYLAAAEKSADKRLPPERQLADELGMSRTLLRQALGALETEGLIWRHVGKGTFAGNKPAQSLTSFRDITSTTSPNEIMEARRVLEPKLSSIAAMRATMTEIKEMVQVLKRASATTDVPAYERWDGVFHRMIAQASRNALLIAIFNMLNATREKKFWGRLKKRRLRPDRIAKYNLQHSDVLDAINNRDPDAAEKAMIAHLDHVTRDLQE